MAKSNLSQSFRKDFNLLEKFIHCLENTNLPYNSKEWDDGKGNAKEHKDRMESNLIEVLAIILINGVFNFLFSVPLMFLGNFNLDENIIKNSYFVMFILHVSAFKMQERHDILEKTIGYLELEENALLKCYCLITSSVILVFVGAILQMFFFWLYNGKYHPFANILKGNEKECKMRMYHSCLLYIDIILDQYYLLSFPL